MNKAQAEKKYYVLHAVFRNDVNGVKPFQNPIERLPADHFLDSQYMLGLFKTTNRWLIQILLLLTLFNSLLRGSGWLRAYQHDYILDNYVEPAVI